MDTLKVFYTTIPAEPNYYILGVFDDLELTEFQKEAVNWALFQAQKLIQQYLEVQSTSDI